MQTAVELTNVSKSFRVRRAARRGVAARVRDLFRPRIDTVVAVDGLSFSIAPGERVAFIGPNGAGKSTTLKVLAGILQPDAGDVRVCGLVPSRQRRQLAFQIGTVFGQRSQLWYHLPARDTFELLGRVYAIDRRRHRQRVDTLMSLFGLAALIDTPVRQLSLGERMRCELAASLLHSPRILFLDEPTIGLDVSAKAVIRELLRTESERERVTLLLTSHDTGDMERVCARVIVIHRGRLLWDGPIAALRRSYITARRVTVWSEAERLELTLPGVRVLSSAAYRTECEIALEVTPLGQLVDAALRQAPIRDMAIEDAPLDDVIRALYADAERRSATA
ncbi:MAG TPA: ATP-binding cassette domain-containing protein [Vicinamibacterales bacterium]|nr:ATP-binding cassette domain-containing protein [Vicinamibacterales bacterium]